MNLLKASLLFVLLSFVFACSEEDTPTPASETELSGNWKVTEIAYTGTSTSTIQDMSFTSNFTGIGYDMDLNVAFADQSHTYTSNGDYSIEITTTMQGQTMTQQWTNQDFMGDGSWSLAGNELTIVSGAGEAQKATILELNANTLKLGYNMTNTTTENGVTLSAEIEGTYTFQRQ